MANRGPSYGLSRECHMKTLAKFDLERAREALHWIEEVTGIELKPSAQDINDQHDVKYALRDGKALCHLINKLRPGSVKKINNSTIAFKEMENIEFFLNACKEWGLKVVDSFQTRDLYEAQSIYTVINCLYSLGSLAQKNGVEGPVIGVKLSHQYKRDFSDEKVLESKTAIGMQYGAYKGASQQGMTPYGMTRKM